MTLLVINGVSKSFGGLKAVRDVSMNVEEGEIIGVIGSNGAGKSTLFNMIAGHHRPDVGEIRFRGASIVGKPVHEIAAQGLVKTFQLVKPFRTMTLRENLMVALLRRNLSMAEAHRAADPLLDRVGLRALGDALPGDLPYAFRRRLEIARALAADPKLLLLDEALAGLTATELVAMLKTLREIHASGVTLVMIEHVMEATMALCQRIVVLHEGRQLAAGTPKEITQNPAVIAAYLGQAQ